MNMIAFHCLSAPSDAEVAKKMLAFAGVADCFTCPYLTGVHILCLSGSDPASHLSHHHSE